MVAVGKKGKVPGTFKVPGTSVALRLQHSGNKVMARKVKFIQGHYYHIYNRGVGRQPIFRIQDNYRFLLHRIKEHASRLSITMVAYCLMPNHYHLLVRQDGSHAVSLLIQMVFNSYSKAFNKMFNRTGTLFEGRFKAIHVDRETYLLHLCRYIHSNPVKDGLVRRPEDWPYSNYLEWIGARNGTLVDRQFVQAYFPQPEAYRRFVLAYVAGREPLPEGMESYLLE